MTFQADLDALLESQSELAIILSQDGGIERANQRAQTAIRSLVPGASIYSCTAAPVQLRQFLSRCLGTKEKCVGATMFLVEEGEATRFRLQGYRFPIGDDGRPRLLLRCSESTDERFSVLTRRIDELNGEIGKRRHLQVVLEESLAERELLVREIHHRVKNNVQMLAALLNINERETTNPAAKAALSEAARRVRAMGAFQQVLYQSKSLRQSSTKDLIATLVEHVHETLPRSARIDCNAEELPISADQALPFSLIVNELLTNAVKHGLRHDADGVVTITLRGHGNDVELCIHNPGSGIKMRDGRRRASGLGLVKGLTRQLSGSFSVDVSHGVTCIVRFRNELGQGAKE
jgi:two-component sensor histidine kinase